jgi:hypothetical protein
LTYEELLTQTRALLNDQDNQVNTNAVLLPYLNLALAETQELFEQNNVPVTNETSAVIEVPSGTSIITFPPDPIIPNTPYLPANLVEIQRVWYSNFGQNNWFPVIRRDFLTGDELGNGALVGYFSVWAWNDQGLKLLAANADLDLKLDYIQKLFAVLDISDLDEDLTVINVSTWLSFRIAALSAEFIDENPSRAQSLNIQALAAMDRSLGISTKGRQAIMTRRRPFRASWKLRGRIW